MTWTILSLVILIGWPTAIWMKRRRIAREAAAERDADPFGFRARYIAEATDRLGRQADDAILRAYLSSRPTPDDLREGM